jgi:flagellar basal-body rod modification protein FlgD
MITNTPATSAATTAGTAGTSSTSSSADSSAAAAASQLGSQSYFLQLLVAQMNNQDPLNPMDSAQVTSQMAEINTVSGIQQLSTQLTQLLSSVSSSQTIQDASLVGQQVLVPGSTLNLANGSAQGAVGLAQSATQVTVTINNASGGEVRTLNLGAQPAGTANFSWDGNADNGAAVAAGQYSYTVTATSGGQSVQATSYSAGMVTAINPTSSGTNLTVAGLGSFSVSQVQQIQ